MRYCSGGVLLLAALLLAACENPKQLVVTSSNQDEVVQKVAKSQRLSDDEKRLFVTAVMRNGFAKALGKTFGSRQDAQEVAGKTVAQLIEEQRSFEVDQKKREEREKVLAAEARRGEDARLKLLRESVIVTPFYLSDVHGQFTIMQVEVKYAIENSSGKDIRAFEGTMKFRDVLGHDVEDAYVKVTDTLKAGEKRTLGLERRMSSLSGKKLDELKWEWVPDTVLFVDGQRVDREEKKPQ